MSEHSSKQLADASDRAVKAVRVCDYCGGRFGMVTHRWRGNKFCKAVCKAAHLREITLDRGAIGRWFGLARLPRRTEAVRASALCVQ